ncbi:MAG: hypothetical protein ACXVKA_14890 [Acidimicrobiia bacterium]
MAADTNNRRLTIMLAIGGVAIALFAAFYLLTSGGGGDSSSSSVATPSTQAADSGHGGTQSTTTTTAPGAPSLPNGQFDVYATRDPFEPAIEVTPINDTGGSSSTGTSTDTTPTNGTTTDTTPASQNPSAGTTVAVIDVFDQGGTTTAVVQVGSTQYTVAAGQVFATNYKVVSLSGTCGQFLFGDSPFSLCKGEQVIK